MFNPVYNAVRRSEIFLLYIVYALYFLGITTPIGFAISAAKSYRFKKLASRNNELINQEMVLVASHYEWLLRTFITMLFMAMAAVGLAYYFVGFIIAGCAAVWWCYRLIRGTMALITHQSTAATILTSERCYGQLVSS